MTKQEKSISEAELIAYVDGELDRERSALIEKNEALQTRANELRSLGTIIRGALQRHACPSADDLLMAAGGLLNEAEAKLLDAHVANCSECQNEVSQLNIFEEIEEADYGRDGWFRRLRESGRQVIEAVLRPGPLKAPVLRGEEDEYLVFDVDQFQISLVKKPPIIEEMGWTIEGQIIDPADPFWETEQVLILYSEGEIVREMVVNTYGYFAADALAEGTYFGEFLIGETSIVFDIEI